MPARRIVLPVILSLVIVRGPTGTPAAPIARAQGSAIVMATLFDNTLTFRTVPFTTVSAELSNAAGRKDQGLGFAGADGLANVTFFVNGSTIEPGDSLSLSRQGQRPQRLTVPQLAAGVDVASDRVSGKAPSGSTVNVEIVTTGPNPQTVHRSVAAGADGGFTVDLAGIVELQPGAVHGSATYTSAEGYEFSAGFASLAAHVTLGARVIRGSATPGMRVSAELRRAGGSLAKLGPTRVGGDGSYSIQLQDPDLAPLSTGDNVTVTTLDATGQPGEALSADLGAITVALDPNTDRIHGTGPANAVIALLADDMAGQRANFSVTTDSSGTYSLSVGSEADLGPGWRVRAQVAVIPGLSVGALAVVRMVQIGVHMPISRGRAEPGRLVTMTLRSTVGEIKAQQPSFVDDEGEYQLFLGGFSGPRSRPVTAEPGDSMEIAFVEGDPQLLQIPELSAQTDVVADTLSGSAPAGAKLRVRVDSAPDAPSVNAVADADGHYRALLAGTVDLGRPSNGRVSLSTGNGNEFYTTWAAVQLNITVGNTFSQNFITGNGPTWRTVRAQLFAPDGRQVAQAEGVVFGDGGNFIIIGPGGASSPQFFLSLADAAGTPVDMQVGDRLRVTAGDDVVELVIPPLDAVVFVQTDAVNGHSLPGAKVTVDVIADPTGGVSTSAEVTADAAGNFAHSFSGAWDIKHGDFVQLSTVRDGHRITTTTIAPGLLVDLDQALLLGSLAPDARATVRLTRSGRVLSELVTRTDASGAFAVVIADEKGEAMALRQGDVIGVVPQAAGSDPLTLTIPELVIDADLASDLISGRATAGGSLSLLALDAYQRSGTLGLAQAWPTLATDGRYATDFVPGVDVRPGTRVLSIYRPPSGNYVTRSSTVPILNAEHAGPNACGFGEVRLPVTVDLASVGGTPLASARAIAGLDGFFSAVLRNAAEKPVAAATGQREHAALGTTVADVTLPPLDLHVDWQNGEVSGTGPADTAFFLQPAIPCPAQAPGGSLNVNISFGFEGRTGPDGALQTFIPPFAARPGSGLELAMYTSTDHRVFRHLMRTLAQVFIHHDRVTGRTNPLEAMRLVLKDQNGTERAHADVVVNAIGRFDAHLVDAAGQPITINAGDNLVVQATTEAPEISVEPLGFDWSPGGSALVGQTTRGRTVNVLLRLDDGQVFTIAVQANSAGTFRFAADDVPPRASWRMTDVVAVRVMIETANGHQVIDQTELFERGAKPGSDGRTVYLPVSYGFRHSGATAAVSIRSQDVRAARGRSFWWLEARISNSPLRRMAARDARW